MAVTTYSFFNWNNAYTYAKWDVLYGAYAADTRYFYSTVGNNVAANPLSFLSYTAVGGVTSRTDNVMRTTFTQTGAAFFQPGSIVIVSGITPDSSACYTGTVLAAGSGYVDYLNPGLNASNAISAGRVFAPIHPYWTTGFYWVPTWSTEITHEQQVIRSPLGEGYSQRFSPVINSNSLSWNLQFDERTDKETMALLNFLQNFGGSSPFVIAFPIGGLYNVATLKYISGPARHGLASYGLNNVTVPVTQIFDI